MSPTKTSPRAHGSLGEVTLDMVSKGLDLIIGNRGLLVGAVLDCNQAKLTHEWYC